MDPISAFLVTSGVILVVFSWFYLMFVSFEEDFNWGLCTVFLPPVSYLYACFNWTKAKGVLGLTILGWFLIILGW